MQSMIYSLLNIFYKLQASIPLVDRAFFLIYLQTKNKENVDMLLLSDEKRSKAIWTRYN